MAGGSDSRIGPGGGQADSRGRREAGPGTPGELIRAIPADHEAERAVLGAILLDHESIWKVHDRLREDSFDQPRHRLLYRACTELADKQQAITLITLRSYLEEQGVLEQIGGVGFLGEVADAVPTAAHIQHHAEVVRQKSLARALIRTCEKISSRGYEGGEPVEDLLRDAEREVLFVAMGHATTTFAELSQELDPTVRFISQLNSGQVTGLATGFGDLDDLTGGFDGGDLVILAARPSMGKTALALDIARNHATSTDGCVAVFSLEMTSRQLVLRLIMAEAGLDLARLRRGVLTHQDMQKLQHASTVLEKARILVDDSGTIAVSDIAAKARRLDREQKLSLIIVDYIQLVQTRKGADRREQEVAEISRSLKLLAKDLDVPILALSQLNRGPETRPNKRPLLADLRESGAIEQDADVVIFIYRDEMYDEDSPDQGIAEIHVAKQRNGPVGKVKLQFESRYARFHNLTGREPPPPQAGFDPALEPPF